MNSVPTIAKFKWLESIGFTITPRPDNTGTIATLEEAGIDILFTPAKMEATTPRGFYSLQGWLGLSLQPFQMIATAFDLVPMSAAERDRMQHLLN